jgi:hypothetical protein
MSTTWSAAKQCGTPQPEPCCEHDCGAGVRNRYFAGKRMAPDALRIEQEYQIERRRLTNRAVHGWGVVYGYPVAMADAAACGQAGTGKRLTVGAGLAFDRMGRELVQTEGVSLSLDDMLELPGDEGDNYLLRVHYAEQLRAPVQIKDACSCGRQEWDHVCETVRYSLQRVAATVCCDPQACELACGCAACCGDETAQGQGSAKGVRDGAARCLCDHLTGLAPGAQCAALTEVAKRLRVDLHNGVPLACLALEKDECGQWRIARVVDACGPRRLVKRNDLLFDLIRGCDLTRISGIGWAPWHRLPGLVEWTAFDAYFGEVPKDDSDCLTKFTVTFSRPVRIATLTPECFSMTFLIKQREGGWLMPMRAPINGLKYLDVSGDKNELAGGAALTVSSGWVSDALRGKETEFGRRGVRVEIEIFGDFILDCNGQSLDADARGDSPFPSGNGTPGGTFRSTFKLAAKGERNDAATATATPSRIATGGNLS